MYYLQTLVVLQVGRTLAVDQDSELADNLYTNTKQHYVQTIFKFHTFLSDHTKATKHQYLIHIVIKSSTTILSVCLRLRKGFKNGYKNDTYLFKLCQEFWSCIFSVDTCSLNLTLSPIQANIGGDLICLEDGIYVKIETQKKVDCIVVIDITDLYSA